MKTKIGLGICWPENSRRIKTIAVSRDVPVYGLPGKVTVPGSRLSLVSESGKVLLSGILQSIVGPKSLLTANGKAYPKRYALRLKRGTVQTHAQKELGAIPLVILPLLLGAGSGAMSQVQVSVPG